MTTELHTWEGRSCADWALAWGVPRVRVFQSLGSTNNLARDLALASAPAFTVILAEEQLEGRGRTGGSWISPPGVGLWMSLLLPGWIGAGLTLLPILSGIGVARAIERLAGAPAGSVRLKWPNDVTVDGLKVCGILCESSGGPGVPVVAGVGVNVLQESGAFPPELTGIAGSVRSTLGATLSRGVLAGEIIREVRDLTEVPRSTLPVGALREWEQRDALDGHQVTVRDRVRSIAGCARGINAGGEFLLERPGGETVTVRSGTVRLAGDSDSVQDPPFSR